MNAFPFAVFASSDDSVEAVVIYRPATSEATVFVSNVRTGQVRTFREVLVVDGDAERVAAEVENLFEAFPALSQEARYYDHTGKFWDAGEPVTEMQLNSALAQAVKGVRC
jgi:hypothetical protein